MLLAKRDWLILLGPNLTRVLETPLSNCMGSFQDLDGDGAMEFLTCDDLFAYVWRLDLGVNPVARTSPTADR